MDFKGLQIDFNLFRETSSWRLIPLYIPLKPPLFAEGSMGILQGLRGRVYTLGEYTPGFGGGSYHTLFPSCRVRGSTGAFFLGSERVQTEVE